MIVKSSQIVDLPIMSGSSSNYSIGHLTPIVDLKIGKSVDYNTRTQTIYWTELENEDDLNATLYTSNIGGGDKTDFFDEFDTGMVGSPYAIAFDWIGQNLYLANREASTIELIKMDGKRKKRMVLLTNDGSDTGVANPVAMALDPENGKLYWLDEGGAGVPAKIGKANMDGSNPKVLLKDNIIKPEFITLDPETEMIYFSSSFDPKIESINADGSNRRPILDDASRIR